VSAFFFFRPAFEPGVVLPALDNGDITPLLPALRQ